MKCPSIPEEEGERLGALRDYGLGSERPLPDLDPVVRIAARMFDMPMAAVNMIGSDHVFFAASTGIGAVDMRRDVSFCAHAILQDAVMVVPDARGDERFHDNPLVVADGGIRFYAGVPLRSVEGHALGALCVIDTKPRLCFSSEDKARLRELACMAADRLELRRIDVSAANALAVEGTASRDGLDNLRRIAERDVITGLHNRKAFYRAAEAALLRQPTAAVIILDIDGFKDMNNVLGPEAGDQILRAVAQVMVDTAGADCFVARLGNDEFAVLQSPADEWSANAVVARLLAGLASVSPLCGHELRIGASCGIALAPLHAQEAVELIGDAALALSRAKSRGSGRSISYDRELRCSANDRHGYCLALHRAVTNGEFLLFFQPQVSLADNRLVGMEALIRWLHPTRGLLSPAAFLPQLERGPLAAGVGTWVIDEACMQAAHWLRMGLSDFRVAVNVFGTQFFTGDLCLDVTRSLARHGLRPEALEIELTENIALSDDDAVLETLHRMRDIGVGIAFDDFGTGYASLSMLTHYPLTRIKIDRLFVSRMLHSAREASVTDAILDIGRNLGISITAEGIETEAQRDYLVERNCPEGQGYLFGRPMPAHLFERSFNLGQAPECVFAAR